MCSVTYFLQGDLGRHLKITGIWKRTTRKLANDKI